MGEQGASWHSEHGQQPPEGQTECAPGNVYIDLGVNWCNTIRLFEDIEPERANASWDVFGFEASPLIQPFADSYFEWLNGERTGQPQNCLPPSGSSLHLIQYAEVYGCRKAPQCMSKATCRERDKVVECIIQKLMPHLEALAPEPKLNDSGLLHSRLKRALVPHNCQRGRLKSSRFTFIPAAVGGASGWLDMSGTLTQILRGGDAPVSGPEAMPIPAWPWATGNKSARYQFRVPVVDFSHWLKSSFSISDHIFVKMDVEGAEFNIVSSLIESQTAPLIDTLSIECHSNHKRAKCEALFDRLRAAAPNMRLIQESFGDHPTSGWDSRSSPPSNTMQVDALSTECLNRLLRHARKVLPQHTHSQ
eukprot:200176-Prymnesium_polylepis.1